MKNNALLYSSFISGAIGILAVSCAGKETEKLPPNIIYILADDLGYAELGCYGQRLIETPNIDRLASEGMLFTDFYSGSPVSAPARCVLLTGQHSGHSGIRGNDEVAGRGNVRDYLAMENDSTLEGQQSLPAGTRTFASLLQQNGYATGIVGKWGLGAPGTESLPQNHGFDFFYGYNCQRQAHTYYPLHLYRNTAREYLDNDTVIPHTNLDAGANPYKPESYGKYLSRTYAPDVIQQEALGFLEANKDKPFFLYYATPMPHVPIQAPQRLIDYYLKKFGNEKPYTGTAGYFPQRYPHAGYAAMVSYIDEKVGELVEILKKTGLYDRTVIIFTSDNGPTFNGGSDSPWFDSAFPFKSERGWGKCYLKEGGIRVPFIAVWKDRIEPATRSAHPCASYDIFSTICDIAGIENTVPTDGISLYPTLTGTGKQAAHPYLYWEFMDLDGEQAVRTGNWKGIRQDIQNGNRAIELYDLNTDWREQVDVAAEHPDVVRKIEEIMKKEHVTPVYEQFRTELLDGETVK